MNELKGDIPITEGEVRLPKSSSEQSFTLNEIQALLEDGQMDKSIILMVIGTIQESACKQKFVQLARDMEQEP